jgi:hypothetical protein
MSTGTTEPPLHRPRRLRARRYLVTERDAITWYPSLADEGFGAPLRLSKAQDEEGPAIVFADATDAYLAPSGL